MASNQRFLSTHWSILRRAASATHPESARALGEFCLNYRGPLLAYAAASYPREAEDLVQGFFERLIEQGFFATADPEKGRLRTFLLTCLKTQDEVLSEMKDLMAWV